jgi:type IV secretion system protein VirB11
MLLQMVDVVVQVKRADGRFRISEIFFDPRRKLNGGTP